MERLVTRRLCTFNTNFLFLLRRSKVSCNFILKISKKFSAFKFSPKLWDKPARTALGSFLRLWSTQTFSALCVWCVGAVLGCLPIPLMNANLDVLFRTHIPVKMQGRVYAARNSLQFFTIPLGYLLGGALVDTVFEPFMAVQTPESLFCCLFGTGKGSGAAFLFLVLGFLGVAVCLGFRRSKLIRGLEANDKD